MSTAHERGWLAGIRVLDLSRVLAGPLCTMLLADLGADVIKVERPGDGDDTRAWGPPFAGGESAYYLSINRGKRGIAVNWQHPEGLRIVRDLILEWADIVVDNARPGALERYGLDPEALRSEKPALIWGRIRGYPPGDDRPGYDFLIQAASGLMSLTGPVDGEPYKVGVALCDVMTGLFLANGLQAALHERQAGGPGALVTVSLWDTQMAALINVAQSHLLTGLPPGRYGNAHAQLSPYETFSAEDGPLAVGVGNTRQFRALVTVLGIPETAADPRFADNRGRVAHRVELHSLLDVAFRKGPRAQWLAALNAAGVPASAIGTVPEAIAKSAESGGLLTVQHPTAGPLLMLAPPLYDGDRRLGSNSAPPLLGEHTDEVLAELGRTKADITALRAAGAVG